MHGKPLIHAGRQTPVTLTPPPILVCSRNCAGHWRHGQPDVQGQRRSDPQSRGPPVALQAVPCARHADSETAVPVEEAQALRLHGGCSGRLAVSVSLVTSVLSGFLAVCVCLSLSLSVCLCLSVSVSVSLSLQLSQLSPCFPTSAANSFSNGSSHGTALPEGNCSDVKHLALEGVPG